ncbi:MAG TPA: GAF domain-containing SpoIIE family protein phosphatase [Chthoniobacterales bacterium]
MRAFLEGVLFAVLVISFILIYRRQRQLTAEARSEREEIRVEEKRVFDFLHSLGEAFSDDIRTAELHRLIVESANRILEAHGGVLYLADRTGQELMPAYISQGCPPLVDIPQHVLAQISMTPQALDSFVRLHPVKKGEGILGNVFLEQTPLWIPDEDHDHALPQIPNSSLNTTAMLAVPLSYAGQSMGVLAVANGPMGAPFSQSDFEVFKSIAEQSAFALYNAIIYYEANEKKRLDHDLHIARDIQRILLPSSAPQVTGFEISGVNIPAKQVSGDYFDYIHIDDDNLGVAIADVSGKGIPASLIMAMCRSVLRSQAPGNTSAADVLHRVNRQLFPDIKEDMFISMAYLILNQSNGQLTLARAGHDAPVLYSASDHSVRKLNPPGMALGIDSGGVFDRITRDVTVSLETNDCLVLYTDGVTEAVDSHGMEYGMEKMTHAIQASATQGAAAVLRRLTEDVKSFAGSTPQSDDITLIAIRKI